MKYYQGRLLNHVHMHVSDLEASRKFYLAIISAIGRADSFGSNEQCFYCDELYVDDQFEPTRNFHLAFQAKSKDEVCRFYEAGIAAGGSGNGAPGYRSYHPCYYAAYLKDPDGNNIEAVCDEGSIRSPDAVTVERAKRNV